MALDAVRTNLVKKLKIFPPDITFAFAYGSGVFRQKGHVSTKDNMLDFILVVNDPVRWHEKNIEKNPKHYSFLRFFGANAITAVQNLGKAKVYFNTLVPVEDGMIKYGVTSRASLMEDLLDWNSLYLSGRLHKPVQVLRISENVDLIHALEQNLFSALHAALLLLPESFSEERLYRTLAGLSYRGDFRMTFGEDRNKVSNIVALQTEQFRTLYSPFVRKMSQWMELDFASGNAEQDKSPSAKLYHLNFLPKTVQMGLLQEWSRDGRFHDLEDVLRAAAYDTECGELVDTEMKKIVRRSSWSQTLKGVLTAGVIKSVQYGSKKVAKMIKSMES